VKETRTVTPPHSEATRQRPRGLSAADKRLLDDDDGEGPSVPAYSDGGSPGVWRGRRSLRPSDFDLITVLGRGAFGKVLQVKLKRRVGGRAGRYPAPPVLDLNRADRTTTVAVAAAPAAAGQSNVVSGAAPPSSSCGAGGTTAALLHGAAASVEGGEETVYAMKILSKGTSLARKSFLIFFLMMF